MDVSAQRPIEWGGKVVQEIGFDKIRQKLRKLKELKIVLVDGFQIAREDPVELVAETCPGIYIPPPPITSEAWLRFRPRN